MQGYFNENDDFFSDQQATNDFFGSNTASDTPISAYHTRQSNKRH